MQILEKWLARENKGRAIFNKYPGACRPTRIICVLFSRFFLFKINQKNAQMSQNEQK